MGSKMYFGGLPTDVDVRALREAFGVPAEGAPITYEQVADVIHVAPGTARFRTVTNAWRSGLWREYGLLVVCSMKTFSVAPPPTRVDVATSKLRSSVKGLRKSGAIAAGTDTSRLTAEQRARHDHTAHVVSHLEAAARLESRRYQPRLPSSDSA